MINLPKSRRLCSRKAIESLFSSGSKAMTAFPVKMVYKPAEGETQMLVSVSKRHFKHAVKRNRVKRQLREAFRLHQQTLDCLHKPVHLAFIWLADDLYPTSVVDQRIAQLLERLVDRLQ